MTLIGVFSSTRPFIDNNVPLTRIGPSWKKLGPLNTHPPEKKLNLRPWLYLTMVVVKLAKLFQNKLATTVFFSPALHLYLSKHAKQHIKTLLIYAHLHPQKSLMCGSKNFDLVQSSDAPKNLNDYCQ